MQPSERRRQWWEMLRAAQAGHPYAIEWVWWEQFLALWGLVGHRYVEQWRASLVELMEMAVEHVEEYAIALNRTELAVVAEYLGDARAERLRGRRSQLRNRCIVPGCPGVDGDGCVHTSVWKPY